MPTIIGLGYKCRQGKNFVANYMQEYNPPVRIYAFADALKLYCKEHHNELVPQWQLANQTKQMPITKADPIYGYTAILQWYGSNVARKANPNCWVEALDKRLQIEKPQIAVVSDVRFENEAKYIKDSGGYMVEVRRCKDGVQFIDAGRDPNHISEIALDGYEHWDYVIECQDGNLADLKLKSRGVLNAITQGINYTNEAQDHSEDIFNSIVSKYRDDAPDGFKS